MSAGRVAVVDDNEHIVEMLRLICRQSGAEVIWTASNGEEALRMLKDGETCDLLILDLTLPDMDGRQLIKAFRSSIPAARILILSGFLPEKAADGWGADEVLQKGSALAELQTTIKRLSHGGHADA